MPFLAIIVAAIAVTTPKAAADNQADASSARQYLVAGVAFYNLENLFDTINTNGTYDLEFSPEGARMWNSDKYWKKIGNLAKAISSFDTPETPLGPAIIGISEIENRNVVEDLVRAIDDTLAARGKQPWNLRIVHHDSPDRRGVDVGLLYNP
ncbi:MAG: endonuclease/exonuclease/phosphatase family protein, partial [Muribaculum sp.]|nr:endonuclease/exonuclease/phosphatase family protein [Muribaculum sp.]